MPNWFRVEDTGSIFSPSLVIDRPTVESNLRSMIAVAGDAGRLRPHVKTHKMPAIVKMSAALGIVHHKCATIAEAEMLAEAGAADVLVAYPVVGPNARRLAALARRYPETEFRALVDDPGAAEALSEAFEGVGRPLSVLVDLEIGMGRTGIAPGDGAETLYQKVDRLANLTPGGLHAYDGHLREVDPTERARAAAPGVEQTFRLRDRLLASGLPVPRVVLGGTPTFPVHARNEAPGVELSPGTSTLHDVSYATRFPDLPFDPAAAVLTRVVSRPRPGRLTLDLGHKAVAADPTGPRAFLPDLPDATLGGQSEEHLVVETDDAPKYPPGTPFLAFPAHVCPTCALHRLAHVFENGRKVDEWEVAARDRVLRF